MSFYHNDDFRLSYVFISQILDASSRFFAIQKYETTSKKGTVHLDANEIYIFEIINLHSEIALVFGRNGAKKEMSTKLSVNCNVDAH